jgi:hypothetical protein
MLLAIFQNFFSANWTVKISMEQLNFHQPHKSAIYFLQNWTFCGGRKTPQERRKDSPPM